MKTKDGYVIIFSVDGTSSIQTDYNASTYDLKEGQIVRFGFLRCGYPCRVEDIFVSDKTKTVFVALTELDESDLEDNE